MVKGVELSSLSSRSAPFTSDWHTADISAAPKKRGHSLSGLSIDHGYRHTAVGKALKQPWPAVERTIAEALGTTPQMMIWSSRYDEEGAPLRASVGQGLYQE